MGELIVKTKTPLELAFSFPVMRQSIIVALVVGTVLCLINQGDALFTGKTLNYWKLGLTYLIPFCVSTYGAWNMARLSR